MFRVAKGNAPYGKVMGVTRDGVEAISNGSDFFFSGERNVVNGAVTGLKYQCVEFARRWLLNRKGLWLPDLAWAAHIFSFKEVFNATTAESVRTLPVKNGTTDKPVIDSLLIYPSSEDFPPGHVAVIVEVGDDFVRIADQNNTFHYWQEGRQYGSELKLDRDAAGNFHLRDPDGRVPLGWVTFPDTATREQNASSPQLHDKFLIHNPDKYELNRVTFKPISRPEEVDSKQWLDAANPAEKKFIEVFGLDANRSRLDESEANYYTMNIELWFACTHAGNSLHQLAVEATKKVLADEELLGRFGIDKKYWPRIRRSFETQPYAISGRFDFVVDAEGKELKCFEYNADSASTLLECAVVQQKWAEHVGVADKSFSSGRRVTMLLEHAWREAIAGGVIAKGDKVHCMVDKDPEEEYTGLFIIQCAEKAGLEAELIVGRDNAPLEWRGGKVVEKATGKPVQVVWKTWSWDTVFEDAEKAEAERGADWKPKDGDAVRLCDVMLGDESIRVFEPLWKTVAANKALFAVMSEMEPDHPNMLTTTWELTEDLRTTGYAAKPIVGRCGMNVEVFEASGTLLDSTKGKFDTRDKVYQRLFKLPKRDDYYAILGQWVVGAISAGTGLREDKTLITNVESPFSAIRIQLPFEPTLVNKDNAHEHPTERAAMVPVAKP